MNRYKTGFRPEDSTIPLRFVGSFEYFNAIRLFNELIANSTESEIKIYDKIITDQPEFSFLSGKLHSQLNSEYADSKPAGQTRRNLRKHSLAWMIALARVELGATLAMYGHADNGFVLVAPNEFGAFEYVNLLKDDVSDHLNALENDPNAKKIASRSMQPESATMAYVRRLTLVQDMLLFLQSYDRESLGESGDSYLNIVQKSLKRLDKKIESATVDITLGRVNREVERGTTKRRVIEKAAPLTPITKACQRAYLYQVNSR